GIFHQKSVLRTPQQNGVVERRNRTLMEAAHTMLIFSKAPMFLWAEVVATACYTQNRSLIHTRHNKTPYELVHDKKPDLITRRLMETIHVTFDEMHPTMAHVRNSNQGSLQSTKNWRLNAQVVPPGTSLSTTIAQDAPSTSASPSTSDMHHPVRHQGIAKEPTLEDSPITHDALHPSFNPVTGEPGSAQSPSGNVNLAEPNQVTQPLDHLRRWTKDHCRSQP
ncbi:retrovirus-related pol polyprotein from transposon TNT 1-94, partial [Tanacetum coccineum]